MPSRRCLKAAEAIRQVISMAILTDINDPRVKNVTVTYVEVAPDMRQAKVHISVRGDDNTQNLCLHGLRSSAGFLQQRISQRIETRYVPRILFVLDQGVKNSVEIGRLLEEVLTRPDDSDQSDTEDNQEVDENGSLVSDKQDEVQSPNQDQPKEKNS